VQGGGASSADRWHHDGSAQCGDRGDGFPSGADASGFDAGWRVLARGQATGVGAARPENTDEKRHDGRRGDLDTEADLQHLARHARRRCRPCVDGDRVGHWCQYKRSSSLSTWQEPPQGVGALRTAWPRAAKGSSGHSDASESVGRTVSGYMGTGLFAHGAPRRVAVAGPIPHREQLSQWLRSDEPRGGYSVELRTS